MPEHSEMILEARVENVERRLDLLDRPCEEGLSREHLAFHWKYSESVAAQLGEIRSKLLIMGETLDKILGNEAKLDRILAIFEHLKEASQ